MSPKNKAVVGLFFTSLMAVSLSPLPVKKRIWTAVLLFVIAIIAILAAMLLRHWPAPKKRHDAHLV